MVFEKKISNTSENGNKSIAYMYKDSSMYHVQREKKNNIQENGGGDAIGLFHSMKPISGK